MNTRYKSQGPPREKDLLEGILVVDKPLGPTSHDIVDRVRKVFGIRKVGHGGTLDPLATGVLVLLLGKATRMASLFLGSDKGYEGTVRLGASTDSHDAAGEVTREGDFSAVTAERLEEVMQGFTGDMMQEPPMVSAIKVDGIPLYKRARKGQTIKREPRLIHVYEFSMKRFELPDADFAMRCTKGTYVRKLCDDIGETLDCGAHLSRLRRTASGDLRIEDALPMNELLAMSPDELAGHILPISRFAPGQRHESRLS
jgi:tRNA pseudouridine55 synthase